MWEGQFPGIKTFNRCPVKFVTNDAVQILAMYDHYKNGFLPISGGLLEQSNVFLQAMSFIPFALSKIKELEKNACG